MKKCDVDFITITNEMIWLLKRVTQKAAGVRAMCSSESYVEAVRTLNKLQSNAGYIRGLKKHDPSSNNCLEDTKKYLVRSGVSLDQLDTLQIIHVAGTKGKGSTCAFAESILRHHGFFTGFYSSPHLISVRERFRINGQPINESTFTHFFWKCYKTLDSRKDDDHDMPQYFKFLTIMMFHIFLEAKIDVAILEVGIGGECDCTNIIRNPICTGITSLGLDHTFMLGETMQEIAFQKSGIFKANVPAFTVPQSIDCMNVLEKRAIEKNCSLSIVPSVENYKWPNGIPTFEFPLDIQNYNVSLAIQLVSSWIESTQRGKITIKESNKAPNFFQKSTLVLQREIENLFSLEKTELALTTCKWPGRTQIIKGEDMNFFIDGAHTVESIECCVSWFQESTRNKSGRKFLIFNATGDRDAGKLLALLKTIEFDLVFFSPNVAGVKNIVDQENICFGIKEQKNRCKRHLDIWGDRGMIVESVSEAFNYIQGIENQKENIEKESKAKVLITGSLHLVGAALCILDPHLNMPTKNIKLER